MVKQRKVNGWTMQRPKYTEAGLIIFYALVSEVRPEVEVKRENDMMRGMRFNDDSSILARLESAYTEAEFLECPKLAIEDALIDAAESDWWYTYEKDYDDDTETDEDSDNDE